MSNPTQAIYTGIVTNYFGTPIAGATVIVLSGTLSGANIVSAPTNGVPGTPLATIYATLVNGSWLADPYGASTVSQLTNPIISDGGGNFSFAAASGWYVLQIYGPTIPTQLLEGIQINLGSSSGTGTVTSVALAADGVVYSSITGSPVTSAGTFTPVLASNNANTFLASPSGSSGQWTARVIAVADLPAATTAAQGIVKLAGDLGGTAASPTVVSTHLAAALPAAQGGTGVATANANLVFAGPTSGAAAAMTPRSLVIADIPTGLPYVPSGSFASPINLAGVTGSLSSTAIVASTSAAGVWQAAVTAWTTTAGVGGNTVTVTISNTALTNQQTQTTAACDLSTVGKQTCSVFTFYAAAASAINYSTTEVLGGSPPGAPQYSLSIRLTYLG
jgi:hypothetical protein